MAGPLSRLLVLDLTRVLAGPWCTQMLADLGADVIKVERSRLGDDTRHSGPPWIPDEAGHDTSDSAYFTSTNRNKRSMAVDLANPQGRDVVREMAKQSDILVENYKVGDLARYGLSYEELSDINLLLCHRLRTGWSICEPTRLRFHLSGRRRPHEHQR